MESFAVVSRITRKEYLVIAFILQLRRYWLYIFWLLAVYFIYQGVAGLRKESYDSDSLFSLVGGILLIVIFPFRMLIIFRRQYRKSLLSLGVSYKVDTDGIYFAVGSKKGELFWRGITKVKEINGFLILICPSGSHFIKINDFSAQEKFFIMSKGAYAG